MMPNAAHAATAAAYIGVYNDLLALRKWHAREREKPQNRGNSRWDGYAAAIDDVARLLSSRVLGFVADVIDAQPAPAPADTETETAGGAA